MAITTVSSREFNQQPSRIKNAARNGPVFITEHGQPAQVLLSIEEYRRLIGKGPSLADVLASPETADFELELPDRRSWDSGLRVPDFSNDPD